MQQQSKKVFCIAEKSTSVFLHCSKIVFFSLLKKYFLLCPKIKLVVFATFKKAWNTKKNVNAFRDTIFCSKNAELKHPDKIEIIRKELNMPGENWKCLDSFENIWTILKPSGQFWNCQDSFETVRIVLKPPDCFEIVRTVLKPSGQFWNHPDSSETVRYIGRFHNAQKVFLHCSKSTPVAFCNAEKVSFTMFKKPTGCFCNFQKVHWMNAAFLLLKRFANCRKNVQFKEKHLLYERAVSPL